MNCVEVESKLDDYFDCLLPALEKHTIVAHLHSCQSCSQQAENHLLYLKDIQSFSCPSLTSTESLILLKKAKEAVKILNANNSRYIRLRKSNSMQGAFAAMVLIGLLFFGKSWLNPTVEHPSLLELTNNSSLERGEVIAWSDVKILINAPQDLYNARIILTLPKGIHVEGYEGLKEISWQTDFLKGANSLVMPVWLDSRVDLTANHRLSAILEYEGQSKQFDLEFALDNTINNSGASIGGEPLINGKV